MFEVALQAAIGAKIIARGMLRPLERMLPQNFMEAMLLEK
ncbi:MAG: hypothetical protein Ct9H300mP6_05500 [Gammaproteobacteria bacterium]|nr:MAG: hypothetical protein Ct9H300mP6_05500 [Gammaproteobacteria bacterium]